MQCFHCGREVRETTHTQKGYRVDYYLLHTGRTEWAFLKDPKEDGATLHYLKLQDPIDIVSCADCYANPQIRQRLEQDFNGSASILNGEGVKAAEKNTSPQPDHG
ncbi:MAG: hypothetical protein HYY45_04500 [Deltaproteobacteria bacterium]|nr:hypothetical protein [Deltaproteobacteria bacterium]